MQGLDGLWKEIEVRALSGSDSDRALTSEAECSKVPVLMRDNLVSLHPALRTWMLRWVRYPDGPTALERSGSPPRQPAYRATSCAC